ncbi:MAG: hypothetical protein AAFX53_00030 [Bacteroidota bacterium]
MELIYEKDYGATYRLRNSPNPVCELQLVIDSVGLFMSKADLESLKDVVLKSHEPCTCAECGGNQCNKIWCSNPLMDICLKVDEHILFLMEDLINGTLFLLNMDTTLKEHCLKPSSHRQ